MCGEKEDVWSSWVECCGHFVIFVSNVYLKTIFSTFLVFRDDSNKCFYLKRTMIVELIAIIVLLQIDTISINIPSTLLKFALICLLSTHIGIPILFSKKWRIT